MNAINLCVEELDQQSSDGGNKDSKVVITSLDYDSLAKIFMLLPIPERIDMEEVCTKWQEACQLAWYDIKEYKCESSIRRCYDNHLLTQSYLEKILSRCGIYLEKLSLSDVCNSTIMPFVGDHCKNLTTLECEFDYKSLTDNADDFVEAFKQLDKLKCIKIMVNLNKLDVTLHLSSIMNSLPEEINEIHLFSKSSRGNHSISMAFGKFKNLQKLSIHNFRLVKKNMRTIAYITTLVHLSIGLFHDSELFQINQLVNLEYFDLTMGTKYHYIHLSTEELESIFCTCKNLKHFNIPPGSYDVTRIPLEKWINFQNLEYLGISCIETLDIANIIVQYCKNLKHLKIYCPIVDYYTLEKLTELEKLESLILHPILIEESIISISSNCKKLKHLEIPGCTIVPSLLYKPLSSPSVLDELSKLQYLEHLNLSHSKSLKCSTITAIANNCKNLKILEIQRCKRLSETALVALTNFKNLQELNVSGLDIITDSFLIKLKGLKKLHCNECKNLTNAGIIQFIENNPDLEFLHVGYIKNITIGMVIGADQATENRTNGIILHIKITPSSSKIIKTFRRKIKSQWLVVE